MLKPKGLNQVLSGVVHPVRKLENMLSPLEIRAPGAFKYENGNHRKGKQVHKPPEESCRTAFCPVAAVGRRAFNC